MNATTATFLAGGSGRSPLSKPSAKASLFFSKSSVALTAVLLPNQGKGHSDSCICPTSARWGTFAGSALRGAAMVARVTSVRVNPEDVDESIRLFDESVIPAAEQEDGFQGVLLLVREDGHALAIDLCDSMEHVRANEASGVYQTQVKKFAGKIIGRPTREVYRVAGSKGLKGGRELLRSA